jgi:tetratricopeptide (TPR) repeat protein
LGDLLGDPRFPDTDRLNDRREHYEKALQRLDPLADQNPDVVDYQTERAAVFLALGDVETQAGNTKAARAAMERAKEVYSNLVAKFPGVARHQRDLAVTLRELAREQSADDAVKAAENLAQAVRLLTELVKQYPEDADFAEQLEATRQITLGTPSSNEGAKG